MSDGNSLPPPGQRSGRMQGWSAAARFEAYVVRGHTDQCWPWNGEHNTVGYAMFRHQGKRTVASRVSWSLHHNKPFPENLQACHKCDNPGCVNPHHIWPGTNYDNIVDSMMKGRRKQKNPATHCKRGHEFSGYNLVETEWRGQKMRRCRACEAARSLRFYHKRQAARRAGAA